MKRIHFGDTFDQQVIKRYEGQGLKEFFISKEMKVNYTNFISNALVTKLNNPDIKGDNKLKLIGESYEIATQEIITSGFNSATGQLTESIVSSMSETVQKIPRMNNFLLKVINGHPGFIYQHAHMCCAIATSCIQETSTSSDKNILQAISFASFFQNIALHEFGDLAKISTDEEFAKLNSDSQEKVKNHALESFKFIQQYKDIPRGADLLIKHHHGSFEGIGLVTDISKLPQLSRIFTISADFVHHFLHLKEKAEAGEESSKPVIDVLEDKYTNAASGGACSALAILKKALQRRK